MTSEWIEAGLTSGPDPYSDWALGAGSPYMFGNGNGVPLYTALVRLGSDVSVDDLVERFERYKRGEDDHPPIVRVSSLFSDRPRQAGEASHVSAIVTDRFFSLLATEPDLSGLVTNALLGVPMSAAALGREEVPGTAPDARQTVAGTVVVGIIDDGIAIAHDRFRRADGSSRVDYAWIQDGTAVSEDSPVPFGRELRKADIDDLIGACTRSGHLDEDMFYRKTGLADFGVAGHKGHARRSAHGTHVMDVAAGFDAGDLRADARPIVCVQLPAAVTADTSGARLDPYVHHALSYILDRAGLIAQAEGADALPVVINFSYGLRAGPHDGTSDLEAAIDEIVTDREDAGDRVSVVLPSGNGHLVRCHAQVAFENQSPPEDEKSTESLVWRVLPDDLTSSFMEIWLPRTAAPSNDSRLEIRIVPPGAPGNPESPWFGETEGAGWEWQRGGAVVCKAVYTRGEAGDAAGRGRFVVSIRPTADPAPRPHLAPSGDWTIQLRNRGLNPDQPVDAWIQRDDTPHGYTTRGRQSYFANAGYCRFDKTGHEIEIDDPGSIVKRAGSISAIATGAKASIVGGYMRSEARPSRYSAGGPVAPMQAGGTPHRDGPDAMAVSDDSKVHQGILAAGTRSGSVVALNGTSVAAPQIARLIADELGAGRHGDRAAVAQIAVDSEAAHPHWPDKPPPERGGAGRIAAPLRIDRRIAD